MSAPRTPDAPDGRVPAGLRAALLRWYRRHARDLPWRRTRDPYRVWLSEVLLQQTRVQTAGPYYARFVRRFPTVQALAAAPLDRVLKAWEGLGYYTRARHLHRAARMLVRTCGGRLPESAAQWRRLPGVGPYTAAAVASIAAGEPVAAVDGNVRRVLARLFTVTASIDRPATQAHLHVLAEWLLSRRCPGAFNQALMDLGAGICTPRRPRCEACPVRRWCAAAAVGQAERLPVRRRKRAVPRVTVAAGVVRCRDRWLLVQRPATGLLAGLWGLPMVVVTDGRAPASVLRRHLRAAEKQSVIVGPPLGVVDHVFSHRVWHVSVFGCRLRHDSPPDSTRAGARWVASSRLRRYALSTLDRKVVDVGLTIED